MRASSCSVFFGVLVACFFPESWRIGALVRYLVGLDSSREEANLTARNGETALMWACASGDIEAARLLVEKGADVEAQDESAASCVCGGAVASDPDSAIGWLAPDPQSRVSLGIG